MNDGRLSFAGNELPKPVSCWPFGTNEPQYATAHSLPKISIVTPNYNYGKSLKATMASVLNQQCPNLEYIVIDGGSSDESCEVIRQHQSELSYWCSERDAGQYSAINKGFARSSGEIMGWINSDDIMMPWTLSTVACIFQQFPEINWITGLPTVIQNGVIHKVAGLHPRPRRLVELGLYSGGQIGIIQQESTFWRRSLWEAAGPLREDLSLAADFALWTQFAERSELASVGTVLGGFSVTDSNRSRLMGDQYDRQCQSVSNEWTTKRTAEKARMLNRLQRYNVARNYTGLKGLVRRFYKLSALVGPVVRWNTETRQFVLQNESFVS